MPEEPVAPSKRPVLPASYGRKAGRPLPVKSETDEGFNVVSRKGGK